MKKTFLDHLFLTSILMIPNFALWFILIGILPLFYTERGELNNNGSLEPASKMFLAGGFIMVLVSVAYNIWHSKKNSRK